MRKYKLFKDTLIILCYVCAAGAFSAFFRWLQNQSAFDSETGLLNPSALNYIVPLVMIGAGVLIYSLLNKLKVKIGAYPEDVYGIFNGKSIFYPAIFYTICGITVLGGILTMIAVNEDFYCTGYRLVALLAILCGISFPLICSSARRRFAPTIMCVLTTLPIVMFSVWLILSYKINASDPTIFGFAIEIITLCLAITAFFYIAGFAYGKPEPEKTVLVSLFTAFMCITALSDSRYFGLQLVFLGTAGMLLLTASMIILNAKSPEEVPAEEITEKSETEEAPAEPVEAKPVIRSGKKDSSPEPTIKAPEFKSKTDNEVEQILREYKNSSEE